MAIRVPRKKADSYQHGDLRHALIQAGLKLLGEGGVRGLSLRGAAELAGVSHAAPYRHFKDKDALVAAIAEEGFRLLTARLRQELEGCPDGTVIARLQAAGIGYVAFAVDHPAYFRVIFAGELVAEPPPSLKAAGQESYGVLRDLIVQGIDSGQLRAGDPDELSLATWSLVHGLAMLIIDRRVPPGLIDDQAKLRQISAGLTQLLLEGLAGR
jgi:AcrR family transcriptional regulator